MLSCWPYHYLKVPPMVRFYKNFRLIFHRKPSCPKNYVLNIVEHKLGLSPGWLFILLEQRFCRALVNLSALKFAIYLLPSYNKAFAHHLVNLMNLTFYFDLVQPFYFLNCNRCFSTFVPVLTPVIYLLITVGTMY